MVDVISSSGWLNPALKAMEMSQMVTQVGLSHCTSPNAQALQCLWNRLRLNQLLV